MMLYILKFLDSSKAQNLDIFDNTTLFSISDKKLIDCTLRAI